MNLTIQGVTYSFATAPAFVIYGTRLLGEMWGSDMGLAPKWAFHRARLWASKYGTAL